jgi:hypothetical protein
MDQVKQKLLAGNAKPRTSTIGKQPAGYDASKLLAAAQAKKEAEQAKPEQEGST